MSNLAAKRYGLIALALLTSGCAAKYPVFDDMPGRYSSSGCSLEIRTDSTFILTDGAKEPLQGRWEWRGIDSHWNDHYIRPENASLITFSRWRACGKEIVRRGPDIAFAYKKQDSIVIEAGLLGGWFSKAR